MSLFTSGTTLNWEYCPASFETKEEETARIEKVYREHPNQVLPPRKRKQTVHFGREPAAKKIKLTKIEMPVQPRLFNHDSIINKNKTSGIIKHKVTNTAFMYHVTYEDKKAGKMWLAAQHVGDAQIAAYWASFEEELAGDYESHEFEECYPVKDGRLRDMVWVPMAYKAKASMEARRKKVAARKAKLESTHPKSL